jgi:hypothetical protein
MNKIFSVDKANVSKNLSTFKDIEWVQINPDTVIVATADRSWLCQSSSIKARFAQPIDCPGSIATTRKLLDATIAAAKYTINSSVRPPALTATRWVWRLAGAYHSSRLTSTLMEKAAKRFAEVERCNLAEWALRKADEERGHDRLALLDIQSMGYNAEAVVEALVPPGAVVFTDYFTRSVQDSDPIDCVGCCYASERLGTFVSEEYIQSVQALLESDTHATRWLRLHSGVGAEVEHVEDTIEVVASLTPQERIRIARACYETVLLRFTPPSEGYISSFKLQQILKPLKLV